MTPNADYGAHPVDISDDGDGRAQAVCGCGWFTAWRDRESVADMAAEHRRLWSASDGHPLTASGRDPRDPMNPWPQTAPPNDGSAP